VLPRFSNMNLIVPTYLKIAKHYVSFSDRSLFANVLLLNIMNALQPPPSPAKSNSARSPRRRRSTSRRQRQQQQAIATEAAAMIMVNLVLAIAAVSALVRLLPAKVAQQAKLQEVETEVAELEQRVDDLRQDFTQYFDARQTRSNMRGLSNRIEGGERQVILIDPAEPDVN